MNLRIVTPNLYRSDQPNVEAWSIFRKLGVHSVMSFRVDGEDGSYSLKEETDSVLAAGMVQFVNIPVGEMPYDAPTPKQVKQVLTLLQEGWLVHCRRGRDRTGVFVACYRISNGWTLEQALEEANLCGMSRLQFRMRDFLSDFKLGL